MGQNNVSAANKFQNWFTALSRREQIIIAAAVVLLPIYLFVQLSYLPNRQQQQRQVKRYQTVQHDNQALQQQLTEVEALLNDDANTRIKAQVVVVEQQISQFDRDLAENIHALVPPQQMGALLRDMLWQRTGLKLMSLKNLPPQAVVASQTENTTTNVNGGDAATTAQEQTSADDNLPMLYRHPIRVEFSGSYPDILAYVITLQQLPQRLFWQRISIEVKEKYPLTQVTLDLYTLSFQKGLIGG